jgi:SAM-dependent methyltransferase
MIDSLKPVSAQPVPCKICGGLAALYGSVDFHKTCAVQRGVRLPLSGVAIYYRRCADCSFVFTDAFDDWTDDQFKTHIYNTDYQIVDPDYQSERPKLNAQNVTQIWDKQKKRLRVLDFGGGNDVLCAALRANGFLEAITYDPMIPEHARRPDGKFELVTCFETLEHLPDPVAGIALILEFLTEPGIVFFTTVVQPENFNEVGLNWWYVGPRNGHISIFSRRALALAWQLHGYTVVSQGDNIHFAYRTLPPYITFTKR